MASVVLAARECEESRLPAVCLYCGAPSEVWRLTTFRRLAPPFLLLALLGSLPMILAVILLTWRIRVPVPLCHVHRHLGRGTTLLAVFAAFLMLLGMWNFVTIKENTRTLRYVPTTVYVMPVAVMAGGVVAGLFAAFAGVSVRRITDRSISFRGVDPAFVMALEKLRASDGRGAADGRPVGQSDWMRNLPTYRGFDSL